MYVMFNISDVNQIKLDLFSIVILTSKFLKIDITR